MKKLIARWTIEPGDGTGNSIQDAQVRNKNGICSLLGCGKSIKKDTISHGLVQKMCPECEAEYKKQMDEWLLEDI